MSVPSKPRGRPAVPPEQVKKHIVSSAMTLLLEKGYEATTLEAIAAHAGVAKKTVYRFADNREALLGLSVRAWTDHYAPLLHRDPDCHADVLPALRKLLSAICDQALSETAVKMFRLLTTDFPGKAELLTRYNENGIERGQQLLSEWIVRQQSRNWLPALPAETTARAILALCVAEPLRQRAIGLTSHLSHETVEAHLAFCMPFIVRILGQGDVTGDVEGP